MKKDLPRGGGVVIAQNLQKKRVFLDRDGNEINNFKERKIIRKKNENESLLRP